MSTTFRSAFALLTLLVLLAPGGAIAWRGFGSWFRSPEDRPAFDAVEPTDWSDKMIAWWGLDEATGTTRAASGGTCADAGADCDLLETGSGDIAQDTTNFVEDPAAAFFVEDNATSIRCTTSCEELNVASDATWGCWVRAVLERTGNSYIIWADQAPNGYSIRGDHTNSNFICTGRDGTNYAVDATDAGSLSLNKWHHSACRALDSADELEIFFDGEGSNTPATLSSLTTIATPRFILSSTSVLGWDGQMDECFVSDTALTDAEICRICSCGIDGSYCMCDNDDPTSYRACNADADCRYQSNTTAICDATNGTCSGRNNSTDPGCSGCTLPDCNAGLLEEPADWSGSMIAWWDLDEASGSRSQSGGTCGADCDLTDNATVQSDATNKVEGDRAASFTSADSDFLSCLDATCDELSQTTGEHITFGCWSRATTDNTDTLIDNNNANTGYILDRQAVDDTARCVIGDGANAVRKSAADSFPITTWAHTICVFDNTADTIQMYIDGATSSSTSIKTDIGDGAVDFTLSISGASFDGQLDECFVTGLVLSDAEICRICSCEIDGGLCACDPDTPANYKSCTDDADCRFGSHNLATCDTASGTCIGRNAGSDPGCGSCALPDCNAAAPS